MTKNGTDAAEREQRANLFALCRAARRKSLRSRINRRSGARAEGACIIAPFLMERSDKPPLQKGGLGDR